MPQKMSQIEFIKRLKEQYPELSKFSDTDIMDGVVKRRPDVVNQVDTLSQLSKDAQSKVDNFDARNRNTLVDRGVWQRHPELANWSRSVLNAVPGVGGIVGGIASTPETGGIGTIPGMALGTGVGTGVRDYIAQLAGLEDTGVLSKAKHIVGDTALAAITPGVIESALHPVDTLRTAAGMASKGSRMMIPKALRPFLNPDFLEEFSKGGKSASGPILTKPAWQQPDDYLKPPSEAAKPNPLTEEFNQKLPIGEMKPGTSEQPGLFESTQPPEGHDLFGSTAAQPNPKLAKLNQFKISVPDNKNVAEAIASGFEPDGPPAADGSIRMVRKSTPTETIPNPKTAEVSGPTDLPNIVSTKGLSRADIDQLKTQGYGSGGIGPDGSPQLMLKKSMGQQALDLGKRLATEDSGSFDWKETWKNLRQMLGRDPSAAEIEAAQARSTKPGESTGNVAPFVKPKDPIPPYPTQEELDISRAGRDAEDLADIQNGIDPNKHPTGPIPSDEELNNPQNDILGVRTRTTLRPANSSDVPTQPRMGQQQLPLGPHDTMPQVDEYGVPQKRDWTPEDIFRINHEMKQVNAPQIPQPHDIGPVQQSMIPHFQDAEIQNYLGKEDARPPEMNDISTFGPPKQQSNLLQKLRDVLDQELNSQYT